MNSIKVIEIVILDKEDDLAQKEEMVCNLSLIHQE